MAPGIADKKNNSLPMWGNEKTMNLNNLILTNILSSHYFKVNLYQLKTYHEVIDEIYYQVTHLEPWEKGSRKTSGQTGMCGGVRGVGAGGIVSTAFCILYKLFTLRLTRKQVVGLINHNDSPYIRALGFMYIRYTQPPSDLWAWYEPYLEDGEEVDVKAGTGQMMTIGEMLRHFLSKLEWFSALFPRIPVPIQKDLETKLAEWRARTNITDSTLTSNIAENSELQQSSSGENNIEDSCKSNKNDSKDLKVYDSSDNDLTKDKDKQKREKHKSVSKRHHSSERQNHSKPRSRSRSPHDGKRYKDRHYERGRSSHSNHRSYSSYHGGKDEHERSSQDRRHKDSLSYSRSKGRY